MISIVMSYFDRYNQLDRTLNSMCATEAKHCEIIIVDDYSTAPPDKLADKYPFNIKIFRMKEKNYRNPCIPFNKAISEISPNNEMVIIQSPEVLWRGDVAQYVRRQRDKHTYHSFHVYAASKEDTDDIENIKIQDRVQYTETGIFNSGWYNHKELIPNAYHFLSAIPYKRLKELNGFDENYRHYVGSDDREFIHRIRCHPEMNIKFVAEPFGIHQYHEKVYKGGCSENRGLFARHKNRIEKENIYDWKMK